MKHIKSSKSMQQICQKLSSKNRIALVPTMGYLHKGHLSLVKIAKKKADKVIVTIFVNPKQFDSKEDLTTYPQSLKEDLELLRDLGVDYVFTPSAKDMYPKGFQTTVSLLNITKNLCGLKRPGHFDGVATVVLKLFNITKADFAVFGKKDYQQLLVIRQMVTDLNMSIKIIAGPIIRESNGLALSSRNKHLSATEHQLALSLSKSLKILKKTCQSKPLSVNKMRALFVKNLPSHKSVKLDYIECLNAKDLTSLKQYQPKQTLIAVAVFVGKTRLIDNIII